MTAAIRRAGARDLHIFLDVRLRALAESPDAFGSTVVRELALTEDDWIRDLSQILADGVLMLAADGDGGVGLVRGEPWDGRLGIGGLLGMWVEPAHRRGGLGCHLVEVVLAWACGAGMAAVELDVAVANVPAARLYEACGFRDTGERLRMPRDPEILEQRMRWEPSRRDPVHPG